MFSRQENTKSSNEHFSGKVFSKSKDLRNCKPVNGWLLISEDFIVVEELSDKEEKKFLEFNLSLPGDPIIKKKLLTIWPKVFM